MRIGPEERLVASRMAVGGVAEGPWRARLLAVMEGSGEESE